MFGMGSLVVFTLLGVLHRVLNMSVGRVLPFRWRGETVHILPFVAFVLLQQDRGGSLMVVAVVDFLVVALVGVLIWIVLTPLWSKWLGTSFTLFVLTLVLSCLFAHVL
jgi:hypothetical protein